MVAPVSAMLAAHMISLWFEQARVPFAFKATIVVPMHNGKGKQANQPSSYRPVAILSALSNMLKKVVLLQLTPILEVMLPERQFGFGQGYSSSMAVATAGLRQHRQVG